MSNDKEPTPSNCAPSPLDSNQQEDNVEDNWDPERLVPQLILDDGSKHDSSGSVHASSIIGSDHSLDEREEEQSDPDKKESEEMDVENTPSIMAESNLDEDTPASHFLGIMPTPSLQLDSDVYPAENVPVGREQAAKGSICHSHVY
ncbi:hypothetical protein M422DRAFT_274257 [Sphaerobolus stellatus SS14]|uniref:Uncharacterized protein n=1 Tax=Sphaerobolus stellatus (strain SS14) TaxID=990650 RepID=A0A0C9U6Z5_SPHS4|nr:hypothetical protein M422DRAFT_274257 [Sphaerobolus stellatus SS14]